MSASTSSDGRCQLSDEKAKSVKTPMPNPGAASTMRLTVSTPARCPAARGRPRASAQRPLPSMIIAACRVLCCIKLECIKKDLLVPHGVDERFHVIEIPLKRAPSGGRQLELRLRHAAFERFLAGEVAGFLEFARMHAEVAIGGVEKLLKV